MTKSEAIKELRNIRPSGGIIPQRRAEAIDIAIKVLEKAEKYYWPDLRKDPEDLPDKLQGKTGMEFYETVQENHEHDEIRASYQYCDAIGAWGWWSDIYDPVTLGFVDTEFHELEEEGYEKVIAWREIEPFEEVEQ